jgi:3-methyladenine DNA glycosylase Tag
LAGLRFNKILSKKENIKRFLDHFERFRIEGVLLQESPKSDEHKTSNSGTFLNLI